MSVLGERPGGAFGLEEREVLKGQSDAFLAGLPTPETEKPRDPELLIISETLGTGSFGGAMIVRPLALLEGFRFREWMATDEVQRGDLDFEDWMTHEVMSRVKP